MFIENKQKAYQNHFQPIQICYTRTYLQTVYLVDTMESKQYIEAMWQSLHLHQYLITYKMDIWKQI